MQEKSRKAKNDTEAKVVRTLIFLTKRGKKKKERKKEKVTRKYVITFTRSTVGNIFGDYSLKFRVTRHSSPLNTVDKFKEQFVDVNSSWAGGKKGRRTGD